MGFFTGRSSFTRFRVVGTPPQIFGPEHLELLEQHQAGKQRLASADGVEVGWSAGDHILDTQFDLAKNIINDMLFFSIRIDVERLPGDLLKAYYFTDLRGLAANNPSGLPSARQKREARESARDRLELEAKDGRYRKRKAIEVIWDRLANEVLFGTTSVTNLDQMTTLFRNTFDLTLEPITAGVRAFQFAELYQRTRNVEDAQPSVFVPGLTPSEIVWVLDEQNRDFIGNEFLLWLWFQAENDREIIELSDRSEVSFMLARTLTLDCPRGQTGHETITSEGPTRLPEARRAIQSGKWPRKVGITLGRNNALYELTLHAESLGISGAKFQPTEEDNERARLDARATQIRDLIETLDLLYNAFAEVRFSESWSKELVQMQKWLMREDRKMAATA